LWPKAGADSWRKNIMPNAAAPSAIPDTAPRSLSPMGALLSYLVPGLGQIYQGRVGKGVLFFVCLYGMFFYGMYLGRWSNVYLVDETTPTLPNIEIAGQQLPGTLAAIGHRPQFAGQFWIGMAAWPAIWQYAHYDRNKQTGPMLGNYQRMPPDERFLNDLQRNSDKRWDLAWVYTVIAGVLNILVIYDAFAGPAFVVGEEPTSRLQPEVRPA
jgi:hypothetical protein